MRVLVTGAAGFLGQHVCSALQEGGHKVVGFDTKPGSTLLIVNSSLDWIQADITQDIHMLPISWKHQLDAVIHLAAVAAPRTCDADPALAFNVNVNGTHQVLKLALEAGAKKFVFVSSAHVYGISPKYLPTDERHPLCLHDTYTTTKILGETLCQMYYENHGLSYTTLRLFNAYGPGQPMGYFIPDMIQKSRVGSIDLAGGSTTKDFVHVDDVARAFLAALETSYVGPINIGTGVESRLTDIARHISQKTGAAFISRGGDGTRMQADYARAKQVLDWEPTVTIYKGLDATIHETIRVS